MSEAKRNHYVPRFYLRNFTNNPGSDTGKFDFYNIKSKKLIGLISYKEQMREKYFYNKNSVIENKLNIEFENKHSILIKQILEHRKTSEKLLLEIILLMYFRTKAKRDESILLRKLAIDTFIPDSFKMYLKINNPSLFEMMKEEEIDKIAKKETYKTYLCKTDVAEKELKIFKELNKQIDDLKTVVLENKTGVNLISSDKPTVKINPFLRSRFKNIGVDGFLQKGLVLFLPLNSQFVILAYDDSVYEDFKEDDLSVSDIKNLNKLQILGALEGVFSTKLPDDIDKTVKETLEKKSTPKQVHVELSDDLSYFYKEDLNEIPELSFIKEKLLVKNLTLKIPFPRKEL